MLPVRLRVEQFCAGSSGDVVLLDRDKASDMILFDRAKAREIAHQYSQFHVNFSELDYAEEVGRELRKLAALQSRSGVARPDWKPRAQRKRDWVGNYFFPLNVGYLCESGWVT